MPPSSRRSVLDRAAMGSLRRQQFQSSALSTGVPVSLHGRRPPAGASARRCCPQASRGLGARTRCRGGNAQASRGQALPASVTGTRLGRRRRTARTGSGGSTTTRRRTPRSTAARSPRPGRRDRSSRRAGGGAGEPHSSTLGMQAGRSLRATRLHELRGGGIGDGGGERVDGHLADAWPALTGSARGRC